MDTAQLKDIAAEQLDRVLGFFPRVDAKASVVLGVDITLLGLLAANAPPYKLLNGYFVFAAIPVALISISLWNLYQSAYPKLEGGSRSLIYFREIAGRTESGFIDEFKAQSEENYVQDLLGQTWRNSEILKQKYDHVKTALIMLAWSIIPWAISLAMFAAKNTAAKNLLVK